MITALVCGFVALVAIAAAYDLALKAIKAWAPKTPLTTAGMIDNTIFAAQLKSLQNDMNALKVAMGFKKALAGQAEAK